MKPNFETMTRDELKAYVLKHRDDQEAVRMLMSRRSPDSEATWYNFSNNEKGRKQIKETIRRKIEGEI